jgi:hypothetical protein
VTTASVAPGVTFWGVGAVHPVVTIDIHQLDDGAWISVNDSREINVSDLWLLADSDFCGCVTVDFLAEGFVDVGVDFPDVEARIAGRCIRCGTEGVTDWLAVGRVIGASSREFRRVDPGGVHFPGRRGR